MTAKIIDITNKISNWLREMILIPLQVGFNLIIYQQIKSPSIAELDELELYSLTGAERILIVAVHPDDRTLSAVGLIQASRDMGIRVRMDV